MQSIKIEDFEINEYSNTFIIAEISANHGHDINIVKEMIRKAKEIGANAIKIQTYTPDTITINSDKEYFRISSGTLWDGKTLYDLYDEAYMPWEWHEEIFRYSKEIGIICFSSPFDKTAVDLLEKCNTPAYKIASFEITDIPLIEYAASKEKPIIISTGIATMEEIKEAVLACKRVGNEQIILLKCTSAYPAPLEEMNLKAMEDIMEKTDVMVGLSDHTLGNESTIAAVALGAKVIEKHFILDRAMGGPDSEFSLNVEEFSEMVKSVRNIEKALGVKEYKLTSKNEIGRCFSRSLFIVRDVKKGEIITEENVRSIRPGYGISPKYLSEILGKRFKENYEKGTPLGFELIDN